jgi:hypothetical protein
MDTLLLAVSAVSVVVALITTAIAWRLSRRERAQNAARVAALSLGASDASVTTRPVPAADYEAEPVAVGQSRSGAPWAAARVTAFASTSRPTSHGGRTEGVDFSRGSSDGPDAVTSSAVFSDGFLGSGATAPSSGRRQRGLLIAALALFVVALAGSYWIVFGDRSAGESVAAVTTPAAPLELVSLRHERRAGRLAVTGLVRNPVAGSAVGALTAVVFLFDQQGAFITSARANLDFLKLAPGDESPFVINVDAPSSVARYRVSFRNEAGLVPHVDRRGQEPIAVQAAERVGR